MGELTISQHEMNKSLYGQLQALSDEDLSQKLCAIGGWLGARFPTKHFMLLCRDKHDYTIFRLNSPNFFTACEYLLETLQNRGSVVDLEYNHDMDGYECWVKSQDNEADLYALFPCDDFIVEVD